MGRNLARGDPVLSAATVTRTRRRRRLLNASRSRSSLIDIREHVRHVEAVLRRAGA